MDQAAIQPYYNNLNSIYDPQRQLIQQQQAALPGQYAAQTSALDQAKVNAFRDITNASNTRGGYFSGFRPSQEARYTGETYLPARAKLLQSQTEQTTSLQQALNQIYGNQQTQAMGLYDTASQRAEQKRQWEAEQAAAESQFQRSLKSSGGGSSTKAPTTNELKQDLANSTAFEFNKAGYDPKTGNQYTEKTLIPYLQTLYPELTAKNIYDVVYPYRKSKYGE